MYTRTPETENRQLIWSFSGHNLIAENGSLLTESTLFNNGIIYSDIDINRIMLERRKMTTYTEKFDNEYQKIYFFLQQ